MITIPFNKTFIIGRELSLIADADANANSCPPAYKVILLSCTFMPIVNVLLSCSIMLSLPPYFGIRGFGDACIFQFFAQSKNAKN